MILGILGSQNPNLCGPTTVYLVQPSVCPTNHRRKIEGNEYVAHVLKPYLTVSDHNFHSKFSNHATPHNIVAHFLAAPHNLGHLRVVL
jgi:hypothetical protein